MTDIELAAAQLSEPARCGRASSSVSKRFFDIVGAALAILVLGPLLVCVAIAVRLEDGGPSLFRQNRTGLGGKVFTIYKFRSMHVCEAEAGVSQACRADPRVTSVGAFIRALSIDELPQLFNVLRGEMSFVGPRPHAVAHDNHWLGVVPAYAERFRVKPGLTGYAQVKGLRGEVRELSEIRQRIEADNYYIDNWSTTLDIWIALRTLPLMFHDPRAY